MSPGDTKNPSAEESTPPETARSWTRRWLFDPDRSVRAFVERSCQEARALVGEIGLDEIQQKIVRSRWVEQGRMYEAVWRRQPFAYRLLRIPIIIGAATLPVLVSLSADKTTTALIDSA